MAACLFGKDVIHKCGQPFRIEIAQARIPQARAFVRWRRG
jgi:hypothetical protein